MFIFSVFVIGLFLAPGIVGIASAAAASGDIEGMPEYMSTWDKLIQSFNNRFYGHGKVPFDVNSLWGLQSDIGAKNMSVLIEMKAGKLDDFEDDFEDVTIELIHNYSDDTSIYAVDIATDDVIGSFWYGLRFSLGMYTEPTLATVPYIETVSLDHVFSITDRTSLKGKTEEGISTQDLREHYGLTGIDYTGEGVKIAVLDTGIFINNTFDAYDTTRTFAYSALSDDDGEDRLGHGSHVISTINGAQVEIGGTEMQGLAPNATVYSIKVLSDKGVGSESDIIKGLEMAMDLDVDIISMSLGGYMPPFTPFYDTIQEAVSNGILVVCAAGNDGRNGAYPAAPAIWDGTISVGALDIDGYLSFFTNLNYDIAAVGQDITAPAYYEGAFGRVTLSGTSMATPVFTALVACFFEAHPSYKGRPAEVLEVFRETGDYENPENSLRDPLFSWDILGYNDYFYVDFPEVDLVAAIDEDKSDFPTGPRAMTFTSIQFWRNLGLQP